MRNTWQKLVWLLLAALALGAAWRWGPQLRAQGARVGTIKKFMLPDYYELPGQTNRVKSIVRGAEAQPLTGKLVALKEVGIETYEPDGRAKLNAMAPVCVLDANQRTATSTGHVQAATADGRFFMEGEGFYFHMTNFHLIISNRVRTVIRRELVNAATP